MVYESKSEEDTFSLAKKIAQEFKKDGGVIFLEGELGAGKTTFVQGFAKELGIKENIISPTFVLVRQHSITDGKTLFHIDLYRLSEESSQKDIGISDIITNKQNIVLIEWPQNLKDLPKPQVTIKFFIDSPNTRTIHVI